MNCVAEQRVNFKPGRPRQIVSMSCFVVAVLAFVSLAACQTTAALKPVSCQVETGIPGPEDFALDARATGGPRLIVSSQQRRGASVDGIMPFDGALFAVPLHQGRLGEAQRLSISNRDDVAFHPVGIDLRVQADGSRRLYVANRLVPGRSVVEIYELRALQLIFRQRLASPLLVSANDLVALDDDALYVSNDFLGPSWRMPFDVLFGLPSGNIVAYRDGHWSQAVSGIAYANGLILSPAQDHLYVAAMRGGGVLDFLRDPATGALGDAPKLLKVPGGVDNLQWEDGHWLNLTSHQDLLGIAESLNDPSRRVASHAYRLDVRSGALQILFADDGQQVSIASTAWRVGDRLILGQLIEDGLVSCPVAEQQP